MTIGIIGLGKMGFNMGALMLKNGKNVIGFDRQEKTRKSFEKLKGESANTISKLIKKLPSPKIVWCMVPAGDVTENIIKELASKLSKGDIIIDGGNSHYSDSQRRAKELKKKGISFLDIGTSGGLAGAKTGYCFMVGGKKSTYKKVEPYLQSMAVDDGYLHCGKSGSGHYVKMVHNAIEYGMMASIAEGFDLLNAKSNSIKKEEQIKFDLPAIANVWSHGSIISSKLIDWTKNALQENPKLTGISPFVADNGEGRWTMKEAIDNAVPFHTISSSVYSRFNSQRTGSSDNDNNNKSSNNDDFGFKLLAAVRNQFGGHAIKTKTEKRQENKEQTKSKVQELLE